MLEKLFGKRRQNAPASCGWAISVSSSGDILLSFADGVLKGFNAPVLQEEADGISVTDAKGGRKVLLDPSGSLERLSDASSVILASSINGMVSLQMAPIVRKGRKLGFAFAKGKVQQVTVDRVTDDGRETGSWRGFVSLHPGLTDIFVEITPAFPIFVGSRIRVVGNLEPFVVGFPGKPGMRFRPGAWVPVADRATMFSGGDVVHVSTSDGEQGEAAWIVATAALAEMDRLRQGTNGEKVPLPLIRVRMNSQPTSAQRGLRSRLARINKTIFRSGKPKGRRVRLKATEWHGAVGSNGDILIEVRRPRFDEAPVSATLILSREWVTTSDGKPSRIAIKFAFSRGDTLTVLLGGGPQEIVAEIARRKTVLVVQGMPESESYADIQVTIAGVEKR